MTLELALVKKKKSKHHDPFLSITTSVPGIYTSQHDLICNEYTGYFEQRKMMELMGIGGIERWTTQYSLIGLIMNVSGKMVQHLPILFLLLI